MKIKSIKSMVSNIIDNQIRIAEIRSYASIIFTFIIRYTTFTVSKVILVHSLSLLKLNSDDILNQVLHKNPYIEIILIFLFFLGPTYQLFLYTCIAVRDKTITIKIIWFPVILVLYAIIGFIIINKLPGNWLVFDLIIGFTTLASLGSFLFIILVTIAPLFFINNGKLSNK